ncbi:MAG: hypothetical protein ACI9DC_000628 [Gammaproteobacteria bacterium]|jgi:hypothetical protein
MAQSNGREQSSGPYPEGPNAARVTPVAATAQQSSYCPKMRKGPETSPEIEHLEATQWRRLAPRFTNQAQDVVQRIAIPLHVQHRRKAASEGGGTSQASASPRPSVARILLKKRMMLSVRWSGIVATGTSGAREFGAAWYKVKNLNRLSICSICERKRSRSKALPHNGPEYPFRESLDILIQYGSVSFPVVHCLRLAPATT